MLMFTFEMEYGDIYVLFRASKWNEQDCWQRRRSFPKFVTKTMENWRRRRNLAKFATRMMQNKNKWWLCICQEFLRLVLRYIDVSDSLSMRMLKRFCRSKCLHDFHWSELEIEQIVCLFFGKMKMNSWNRYFTRSYLISFVSDAKQFKKRINF